MIEQFCEEYNMFNLDPEQCRIYECDRLDKSIELKLENNKNNEKNDNINSNDKNSSVSALMSNYYNDLFDDFLNIRYNLYENELYALLNNKLKVCKSDIKDFYKFVKFQRKICGLLPSNYCYFKSKIKNGFKNYQMVIDRFGNNKNKSDKMHPILLYFFIWNVFFQVMTRYCITYTTSGFGFDHNLVFRENYRDKKDSIFKLNNNNNNNKELKDKVCSLLSNYLIKEFAQYGVFSNLIENKSNNPDLALNEVYDMNMKQLTSDFIKIMFNNDLTEFNNIIKESIKDIKNISKYEINIRKDENDARFEYDCGISFILLNRIVFIIFNDLSKLFYDNNNNNNNDNKLLYPNLEKFYKFLYNFGIYMHCYPNHEFNEAFYLNEYFLYKNSMFNKSHFVDNNNINYLSHFDDLTQYCYFVSGISNGTLLHKAADHDYRQLCQILMHNGFDILKANIFGGTKTPLEIASTNNHLYLVSMMQSNNAKNESESLSNNNEISKNVNKFSRQIMYAKYFLLNIGFNIENDIINLKNNNDFFIEYNKLVGLKNNEIKLLDPNGNFMNSLVKIVIDMLNKQLLLSDDILVLCFEYLQQCVRDNKSGVINEFIDSLINCVSNCLNSNNARNYYYFKEYLLFSNILYYPNIYKKVYVFIDKQLLSQKQYIWDSIQHEQKSNENDFTNLCKFGEKFNQLHAKINNNNNVLRQDSIKNGIECVSSEHEIYMALLRMHEYNKNNNKDKSNYSMLNEFNDKVYLTQCLSFANENNGAFQSIMNEYFSNNNGKYSFAPVKTYARCLIKANTDYIDKDFPCASNIIDFLRCSIVFDDSLSMLNGLNKFINDVNNGKIPGIISVLRVKNGFCDILSNWQSFNDAEYCDIKLNVIYQNSDTNVAMIVETQWLLYSLLKAKKMGHKYYNIKRRQIVIENVSNNVFNINLDYDKYNNKIMSMVNDNNIIEFGRELLLKPNIILSIMCQYSLEYVPLLYMTREFIKLHELCLHSLFHFSTMYLNENINEKNINMDKSFISKYLNFKNCHEPIIEYSTFVKFFCVFYLIHLSFFFVWCVIVCVLWFV